MTCRLANVHCCWLLYVKWLLSTRTKMNSFVREILGKYRMILWLCNHQKWSKEMNLEAPEVLRSCSDLVLKKKNLRPHSITVLIGYYFWHKCTRWICVGLALWPHKGLCLVLGFLVTQTESIKGTQMKVGRMRRGRVSPSSESAFSTCSLGVFIPPTFITSWLKYPWMLGIFNEYSEQRVISRM